MASIQLTAVSKRYQRLLSRAMMATSLKSYFLSRVEEEKLPQDSNINEGWAVQDVNLNLQTGKTLGVIGRNGSGKSTLLKLMGGILGPDTGHVNVKGRVAALIELGAGFHPELTGRENLLINGVILGLSRKEVRLREPAIIEFADIGKFIDYPVRTYSSGMYARLAFAVAMHVDADILLIDEILSVGDAEFVRKCAKSLERFRDQGKSIVIVSHDLEKINEWCEHTLWLNEGRVCQLGPTNTVVEAYQAATQA